MLCSSSHLWQHALHELLVATLGPTPPFSPATLQEAAGMMGNGPGAPGFSAGEDPMRECILLAACGAGELLPQNPELPADVFTACLTTPIKVPSHIPFPPVIYCVCLTSVLQPAM